MKIVICAAGLGSRLGLGLPKCLAKVGGRSILQRQLDALHGFDVTVVTGFKHELVEREADGVHVVVNHNYATTTVVDSARAGIGSYRGDVVVIDGDVLFTRSDIERVIQSSGDVIGVTTNISESNPVFVEIEAENVVGFTRESRQLEWAGISKLSSEYLWNASGFMFETLADFLPMRWALIDSIEIDTPGDLREAIKWTARNA